MKWFTREWATGQLSDEEAEAVPIRYAEHVNSLADNATQDIRTLLFGVGIHDGHVKGWDQKDREIALTVIAGDLQSGYKRIELRFRNASLIAPASLDELDFGHPRTELLYDEVDIAGENLFEYRILIWPKGELVIQFDAVSVQISDANESDP